MKLKSISSQFRPNTSCSGFTLPGAIIAIVIIVSAFFIVAELTDTLHIGEKRLDRIVAAEQVLALTARTIMDDNTGGSVYPYSAAITMCSEANGAGTKPINANTTWDCVDPATGKLDRANMAPSATNTRKMFRVLLNEKGDPDANLNTGIYCVELTRCLKQVSNAALDITITAFYPDADQKIAAHSKTLIFRKAK